MLGWEAFKLKTYNQSIPVIEAQLAKLSPSALGKAKREDDDEKSQDKIDREVGEAIVQEIRESMHFRAMPQVLQGAWIREHSRRPGEKRRVKPIKGMSAQLVREVIALGTSGRVADSTTYWSFYRRFYARLNRTARN